MAFRSRHPHRGFLVYLPISPCSLAQRSRGGEGAFQLNRGEDSEEDAPFRPCAGLVPGGEEKRQEDHGGGSVERHALLAGEVLQAKPDGQPEEAGDAEELGQVLELDHGVPVEAVPGMEAAGIEVPGEEAAEQPPGGRGGDCYAPGLGSEVDEQGDDDEEDGGLTHEGVDGERDDEGQGTVRENEDGCDAEEDEVRNVVGVPERLLVARGVTGVEDGEQKRPEEPPVTDGEILGGTDGPEAKCAEEEDADDDAGELGG